jgi:hypothetical protein
MSLWIMEEVIVKRMNALAKSLFMHQDDQAGYKRIHKEVQITLRHEEFDYLYLEFSNGQRIKLVRPAVKDS